MVVRWGLVRRKVRDIYGNWVWEDEEDKRSEAPNPKAEEKKGDKDLNSWKDDKESENKANQLSLEWRDYVALVLASLQTILLPIVLFIAVIIALVFIFALFK
jgi:hypothetical protein